MTFETATARSRRPTGPEERAHRSVEFSQAVKWGAIGGAAAIFVSAVGMVAAFDRRSLINPFVTLGYLVLFLVPLTFGYIAGRPPVVLEGQQPVRRGPRNVMAGALAGLVTGVLLAVLVVVGNTFNMREILVNVSPAMIDALTFGQSIATGIGWLAVACAVAGAMGGAINVISERWRGPIMVGLLWVATLALLRDLVTQLFRGLRLDFLIDIFYAPGGGMDPLGVSIVFILFFALAFWLASKPPRIRQKVEALSPSERRRWAIITIAVSAVILYLIPIVMGRLMSEILDLVGIFLLMALGLNIVVGFAGLLDLGYVAFFAVGAYGTAVLTSPNSPALSPELLFWAALPFVVLAAAFSGVLVGTPVLRMRGDYLAIVTLGFGEIARILFLSDWFGPVFGGAQGITRIPTPSVGPLRIDNPQTFFYPIVILVLLAAFVTWALANSRIGRAWNALREDETVAEALGINIVTAKLSAFIVGAALASFSGAIFASKIGAVFPNSFSIIVSIIVLVIIIVGGMGNLVGVAVGALVIQGLPQLLREFDEFRFLLYGGLLIFMMLTKPEGLIPSQRRLAELHQSEMAQDDWLTGGETSEDTDDASSTADAHRGIT